MAIDNEAAHHLTGLLLANGWRVLNKIEKSNAATSGYFSVCYIVEKGEGKAFLKALNVTAFFELTDDDLVDTMQRMTKAFQFERNLLLKCQGHKLSKIISLYDSGQVTIEGPFFIKQVPYLIFELAQGDVREKIEFSKRLDITWKLNSIHDVAVGMKQLHSVNIAHQDLKAANVFATDEKSSKIGDLGNSLCDEFQSPHDNDLFPGDKTNAPPEFFYNYYIPNKNERAFSIDCYLLGSLICFYFLGTNMTALIKKNLDPNFDWHTWRGNYDDVLPYLMNAFDDSIGSLKNSIVDEQLGADLSFLVQCLCHPDPLQRGHPKTIESSDPNQFNLERIVNRIAILKRKAEYNLLKK